MAKAQHVSGYRLVLKTLRDLRIEAGLTQRDLAVRVSRPQPWVHKTERGERRLDILEFLLWCEACGVPPEEGLRRLVQLRK